MSENLVEVFICADGTQEVSFSFKSTDINPNEISAEARDSNTSWKFSGRHDHGLLAELNDGFANKEYAQLICSIKEAKMGCDEYITGFMKTTCMANSNDVADALEEELACDEIKAAPKRMKQI